MFKVKSSVLWIIKLHSRRQFKWYYLRDRSSKHD